MNTATLTAVLYRILLDAALVVGPPLLLGTLVAFLIGLLQAVTQVQEQTMPQTVKIVVIAFVMLAFGSMLVGPLYASSNDLFANFHIYRRQ